MKTSDDKVLRYLINHVDEQITLNRFINQMSSYGFELVTAKEIIFNRPYLEFVAQSEEYKMVAYVSCLPKELEDVARVMRTNQNALAYEQECLTKGIEPDKHHDVYTDIDFLYNFMYVKVDLMFVAEYDL